jgi:hypothetical protein
MSVGTTVKFIGVRLPNAALRERFGSTVFEAPSPPSRALARTARCCDATLGIDLGDSASDLCSFSPPPHCSE